MTITPFIEVGLAPISEEIRAELTALKQIFFTEVAPRANRIGELLKSARTMHNSTNDFYLWVESEVGIKERQCRTYLAFHNKFALIQDAADEEGISISSMEQGLALLAPANNSGPDERTHQQVLTAKCVSQAARARGAIRGLGESIAFLREDFGEGVVLPGGITQEEIDLVFKAQAILQKLDPKADPLSGKPADPAPQWTDPQPVVEVQPIEESQPAERDTSLPLVLPPRDWTLSQLEEGKSFYGSWQKLANAMAHNPNSGKPYSKQSLSLAYGAKTKAAGLESDD